jgi:hypothetical protein
MHSLVIVLLAGSLAWGDVAVNAVAVPTAPTGRSARVSVEARPPRSVKIFLNGRKLGTTPIVNVAVRPGRHVFEAVRPDGARIKRVIRLRPAQNAKLVLAD